MSFGQRINLFSYSPDYIAKIGSTNLISFSEIFVIIRRFLIECVLNSNSEGIISTFNNSSFVDDTLFLRAEREPATLIGEVPKTTHLYVTQEEEVDFMRGLLLKSPAKFCEYSACKIYHFIEYMHGIRIKSFLAIFSENEVGNYELIDITVYQVDPGETKIPYKSEEADSSISSEEEIQQNQLRVNRHIRDTNTSLRNRSRHLSHKFNNTATVLTKSFDLNKAKTEDAIINKSDGRANKNPSFAKDYKLLYKKFANFVTLKDDENLISYSVDKRSLNPKVNRKVVFTQSLSKNDVHRFPMSLAKFEIDNSILESVKDRKRSKSSHSRTTRKSYIHANRARSLNRPEVPIIKEVEGINAKPHEYFKNREKMKSLRLSQNKWNWNPLKTEKAAFCYSQLNKAPNSSKSRRIAQKRENSLNQDLGVPKVLRKEITIGKIVL